MSESPVFKQIQCLHCGHVTRIEKLKPGDKVYCENCHTLLVSPPEGSCISTPVICPYCSSEIQADSVSVICPSCQTEYHVECWQEGNGCQTYGCAVKNTTLSDNAVFCARCHTPILENQPIVLCPECAHAYHSHCWEQQGCAVSGCRFENHPAGNSPQPTIPDAANDSAASAEGQTTLPNTLGPSSTTPSPIDPAVVTDYLKTIGWGALYGLGVFVVLYVLDFLVWLLDVSLQWLLQHPYGTCLLLPVLAGVSVFMLKKGQQNQREATAGAALFAVPVFMLVANITHYIQTFLVSFQNKQDFWLLLAAGVVFTLCQKLIPNSTSH